MNAATTRTLAEALTSDTEGWATYLTRGPLGTYSYGTKYNIKRNSDYIPSNDVDAAEWIIDMLDSKYTYVSDGKRGGTWYYWNGQVHVKDEVGNIDDALTKAYGKALKDTFKTITDEIYASTSLTKDDKKEMFEYLGMIGVYVKQMHAENTMSRLRSRLRTELSVNKEYFDNDREFTVLSDGRVLLNNDLTAPPMEPSSKRPVTNQMTVTLGGTDVKPGMWAEFLNRLGLAEDDQKYLQVMAGAALLGRGDAKNIAALVGISNTGKTTYAMALYKIFGGYAGILPPGAIVDKGSTNFDQYKARGKRFVLLEEPYEKRTDDSFLKNLSGGGGTVPTQEKGKNGVEWLPQCVLHITANHEPRINTQDDAIVQRLNIVAFNVVGKRESFEGSEKRLLMDQLVEDCPNEIFAWVLEGAKYYDHERTVPKSKSITERASKGVIDGSVVLAWLNEQLEWADDVTPPRWIAADETVPHSKMVAQTKEEYDRFSQWLFTNGEKNVSKKQWASEINRYMKEPQDKNGLRPGGSVRLWGLIERDNTHTNEAIALRDGVHFSSSRVSSFAQTGQRSFSELVGR